MKAVKANIKIDNNININFSEPISGITPGQACVLYDINDGHLLGGSFIGL
jgi:tRNA U34 2-thiouridine synthase MnmA/TrmU